MTATKERNGMKAREVYLRYPKDKADSLMKKLREKGMFHWDEDFPRDEEEIFYFIGVGNSVKDENITSEKAEVAIKTKGDKELTEALIGENGMLAAGAVPDANTASEAGSKAVLDSVAGSTAPEKKGKRKTTAEKSESLQPKTILEYWA